MWLPPEPLAIPAEHLEVANAISHVLDPDTGGVLTFPEPRWSETGEEPATHSRASVPFMPEVWALLQTRDPDTWEAALAHYSAARDRPMPSRAQIETICEHLMWETADEDGVKQPLPLKLIPQGDDPLEKED